MWPNFFTRFPFPFPTLGRVNYNTLPTVAVTVGTENVTLELPNHAFRNRDYVGGGVECKNRFNIHFALYPDKYGLLVVIFRFVVCLMM